MTPMPDVALPKNLFKARLKSGEQQFGAWHSLGSALDAEVLAAAGYDWVLIDSEHGPMEVYDVLARLQALSGYTDCAPVVRISTLDTALIKRHLDQGAQTLMVPMINSAQEARDAVAAMRFAPEGTRGLNGISRATRFGAVSNYAARAAEELCLIVQVESQAALAQIEEIAQVPGVDAVFIGPADLAADMGYAADLGAPQVRAAVLDGIARLKALGVPSGIVTLDEAALRDYIAAGTRFTALGIDAAWLMRAARDALGRFKTA
nr:HpcH/HpaI aldolase/citrate lyase family protein [uncultured Celeribacter sp.]